MERNLPQKLDSLELPPSQLARNPCDIFGSDLNLMNYVGNVTVSAFYHLKMLLKWGHSSLSVIERSAHFCIRHTTLIWSTKKSYKSVTVDSDLCSPSADQDQRQQ